MAPNLTVRSDSWQDLSQNSAYLANDQRRRRGQFIKQASVPPDSMSEFTCNTPNHHHNQSIPSNLNAQLSDTNYISTKDHLLIRLRQRSYLEQQQNNSNQSINLLSSWSTSNLSNSIDLQPYNNQQVNCELINSKQQQLENSTSGGQRRELSFGLRSFRSRFERRKFNSQRGASPFARSWSSLSERVNSKLSQFVGHSWKSFLYNYQHQHPFKTTTRPDGEELISANQLETIGNNDNAHQDDELSHIKRRLTADWISRHAPNSEQEVAQHSLAREDLQKIRPKSSIQLPTYKRNNKSQEENDDNEYFAALNRHLEARKLHKSPTELISENHQKELNTTRQSTGCASDHLLSDSNCSSSTTTATLVCESHISQQNLLLPEPNMNPAHRLLLSPPPPPTRTPTQTMATSDYWSATSGSGNGGHQLARNYLATTTNQLNEQECVKNLIAQQQQQLPDQDQDYYLDVAAAAQFELQQQLQHHHQHRHHLHQFAGAGTGEAEQVTSAFAGEDDYDDYAVPSDESCCRLDRSQVELVQLIGEGQKGYVFLGKLQSRNGATIIDVAIKTLKYETETLIERLMSEASMMKQLEHPHIIKFIGMCPETPALIAMELAKFGELKHYLKLNANSIRVSQLVLFAFQISTALSYLESKNYVHRDVAARNVLVCAHQCVKLADFGLSRNLQSISHHHQVTQPFVDQSNTRMTPTQLPDDNDQQYVAAPRVKLPVRWLAPESLVFRRFTSASDVWMFAVFTWELFQLGLTRPWPALRNNQVLLAIESGRRLARPDACPQRLYQLMLKCWSYAPVQRPKFREIKQSIWSIYLNERTREQLELEHFEREKQRHLLMNSRQSAAKMTTTILSPSDQTSATPPAQLLLTTSPASTCTGNANYAPASSNYSTATATSTTSTAEHQRSTSPGSSAFSSLARAGRKCHEPQVNVPQVNTPINTMLDRDEVLCAQQVRFSARKSPVGGGAKQPHVLQKQRSQGAIGTPTQYAHAHSAQVFPVQDTRGRHQQQQQRRPALDDAALEQRAVAGHQRLYSSAAPYYPHDQPHHSHQIHAGWPEVDNYDHHKVNFQQPHNRKRFLESLSPALTVDRERHASMEPNYEGVAKVATPTRAGQVAMLRTNYERTAATSPINNFRQLTSSPALTCQSPVGRPSSWASRQPFSESPRLPVVQNETRPRQVEGPADQLGQMLQALRITPMKAKLRNPPEQIVRVLQPTAVELSPTGSESSRQQLHQRLLGRIRSSGGSGGRQQQAPSTEAVDQRLRQQKSVEMVDSSLELLESLMSPSGAGVSLPRRRRK